MYRLTAILLLLSGALRAQELSYNKVDSLTYTQFIMGRYNELEKTGKAALDQNIDFYYLRMRLGIAQYETHHYEK